MSGVGLWVAIGAGGAVGALARHSVSRAALHLLGPNFPWGTLAVNLLGSFFMGLIIVWLSRHEPQSAALRGFLTVGLLGAFTTFSTFALDAVVLIERKAHLAAAGYVGASVLFSILGLALGLWVMRAVS
ncbi:MAG: fluoride efflux transporter CrcB [Pseudomonadota bacterium]